MFGGWVKVESQDITAHVFIVWVSRDFHECAAALCFGQGAEGQEEFQIVFDRLGIGRSVRFHSSGVLCGGVFSHSLWVRKLSVFDFGAGVSGRLFVCGHGEFDFDGLAENGEVQDQLTFFKAGGGDFYVGVQEAVGALGHLGGVGAAKEGDGAVAGYPVAPA